MPAILDVPPPVAPPAPPVIRLRGRPCRVGYGRRFTPERKRTFLKALSQVGGNLTKAAELVHVSWPCLWDHLQRDADFNLAVSVERKRLVYQVLEPVAMQNAIRPEGFGDRKLLMSKLAPEQYGDRPSLAIQINGGLVAFQDGSEALPATVNSLEQLP